MIFLVVNSFGADTSFWSQKPTEWIEKNGKFLLESKTYFVERTK